MFQQLQINDSWILIGINNKFYKNKQNPSPLTLKVDNVVLFLGIPDLNGTLFNNLSTKSSDIQFSSMSRII